MSLNKSTLPLALLCACSALSAQTPKSFDPAAAFGARPGVTGMSLSPDGKSVAYIAPTQGQGSVLVTMRLDGSANPTPKTALIADGKPARLESCGWVSSDRLVCLLYALVKDPTNLVGFLPITRQLAVNADGSNMRELSNRLNSYSRGYNLHGGNIIDWLPEEDGSVLMTREYLPDDHTGSHIGSSAEGLGVDRVNTRTLAVTHVESPNPDAVEYHSDGHGTVRVMGVQKKKGNAQETGLVLYSYRLPGSREWRALTKYNWVDGSGLDIYAVDRDLNVAYGFKKKDGLRALYSISLDAQPHEELIYSRTDVDVDSLIQIGRRRHVVGALYELDSPQSVYFDSNVKSLLAALSKALPQSALGVMESSADEQKMLIFSGSDRDPGVYYIFDRAAKQLQTFLVARGELEGVTLATMKPVSFPASDGTSIPGFLTMPPGKESAKGLPAIVMPHGGPSSRDSWGFDWWAQFYAARGFAVLQPNYRGSTGYGDAWLKGNGFRSWQTAIGDVLDAGRWLVHEGIADPSKLAIVGGSYGGYAALQSSVVDPTLFKAIVAVAPVTDLGALKDESYNWSNYNLVSDFIGDGKNMHEGSPIEHAEKIKAPVLLFHGEFDRNVSVNQSKRMAARLQAVGGRSELVTWPGLDHHIEDSAARIAMLRKSDAFLRKELAIK